MEKILLAIDAVNPDTSAFDFACYLGRLTKSKVTGIFLENLVAEKSPVLYGSGEMTYLDWQIDQRSTDHEVKQRIIEKNIELFKSGCESRSVKCAIHRDRNLPAAEIINESRFADLLILDAATSFNKRFEGTPTEFVKDVLKDAECPVIIAPESFSGIDEIIFTYSNTSSCAFAIKQFTYLFPMLNDKKATILQINKHGKWADSDKYLFNEWLKVHFSSLRFETLKGDPDDKLFDYLFKRKNVFIVMGAYGRTSLSRFFYRSQADRIISTITQPIFISHY
jgi:nucleotide-binding universal stress UspA family protein